MAPVARFDSLRTERLVMRRWQDRDREPFAALNADPQTMRFFLSTLDRAASDALIDRFEERFEIQGFGLWALEIAETGQFIRFAGLNAMPEDLPGAGGMGGRLAAGAPGLAQRVCDRGGESGARGCLRKYRPGRDLLDDIGAQRAVASRDAPARPHRMGPGTIPACPKATRYGRA